MAKIQKTNYKQNGKVYTRFSITLENNVMISNALNVGDSLSYAGSELGFIKFKIIRQEEIKQMKIKKAEDELKRLKK